MARVAFYTFGVQRYPWEHPHMQSFLDRVAAVFAAAECTEGFIIRRSDRPADAGPRFYDPAADAGAPQTLSVWADLESVFAFAHRGRHGEAMRHRTEWFVDAHYPTYVAWWVADDHLPTWHEAAEHLEHLHDHGPTAAAFSFKHPFDAQGAPTVLDQARVARRATTVR